jgi:hypothetical protein
VRLVDVRGFKILAIGGHEESYISYPETVNVRGDAVVPFVRFGQEIEGFSQCGGKVATECVISGSGLLHGQRYRLLLKSEHCHHYRRMHKKARNRVYKLPL